jgi:hypothetical protein
MEITASGPAQCFDLEAARLDNYSAPASVSELRDVNSDSVLYQLSHL